jgi:hypothetical protein
LSVGGLAVMGLVTSGLLRAPLMVSSAALHKSKGGSEEFWLSPSAGLSSIVLVRACSGKRSEGTEYGQSAGYSSIRPRR